MVQQKRRRAFCAALDVQCATYEHEFKLDMLKDAMSIPGLTLRYLFKNMPPDVYFSLFSEKHNDLHTLLREQMVGGPSIVFSRYQEANETKIRGDKLTKLG